MARNKKRKNNEWIVSWPLFLLGIGLLWIVSNGCTKGTLTTHCKPGEQRECTCSDGTSGAAVCTSDEVWTDCDCGSATCEGITCSGHGTCSVVNGKAQCDCETGFHSQGLSCVSDSDPCDGVTCSGHGTCSVVDNQAQCTCDSGYRAQGIECVADDPCGGVDCSGHGTCSVVNGNAQCDCDQGYHADGLACVDDATPCSGQECSGHGHCVAWEDGPVCVCDSGYTPSRSDGLDCVPTTDVCVAGPIDYDVDGDGTNETQFTPNSDECLMYEMVNRTRATHDPEGHPESHKPLAWDVLWSAHARNHSYQMKDQGGLYHDDHPHPGGQNVARGCDPACEMDMYMNGDNEGHCPDLSHHCNIMRPSFSYIGIGYVGTWNTQNFR